LVAVLGEAATVLTLDSLHECYHPITEEIISDSDTLLHYSTIYLSK
jgi:hypothetical protein